MAFAPAEKDRLAVNHEKNPRVNAAKRGAATGPMSATSATKRTRVTVQYINM